MCSSFAPIAGPNFLKGLNDTSGAGTRAATPAPPPSSAAASPPSRPVEDFALAGAITAALFLRRFVPEGTAWAHFDTFAWRPSAKPGRPKGGEALGLRAVFSLLTGRYGA